MLNSVFCGAALAALKYSEAADTIYMPIIHVVNSIFSV